MTVRYERVHGRHRLILASRGLNDEQTHKVIRILNHFEVAWWRYYNDFFLLSAPIETEVVTLYFRIRAACRGLSWLALIHVDEPDMTCGTIPKEAMDWLLSSWDPAS